MATKPLLSIVALVLIFGGCSCDEDPATATDGVAANLRTHLDLAANVHLADVDHQGLFIDFGTPAYRKYTVGNWRTGWGKDITVASTNTNPTTTATYVGRRGRLYFNVDVLGAHTIRLRLRIHGTHLVTPYMNGEALPTVSFQDDASNAGGFQNYDFTVPAENIVRGENYLNLVFGGVTTIDGEDVSVAMASIRVVPGEQIPDGTFLPPLYASESGQATLDGSTRSAVFATRPTTLTWTFQVPERARLAFGVGLDGEGTAPVSLKATPEDGETTSLFSQTVNHSFHDANLDLARFAGKIVRFDFASDGEGPGRIAWSTPRILVPLGAHATPEPASIQPAQNVVVLLVDTLRSDKLRAYNPQSRVQTPIFNQIAEEGTLFEQDRATENWTKPSVASVLTGLYPTTHGARSMEAVLPDQATLISEHLHSQGFATSSFIANGYVSRAFGFDQGWDHYTNYLRENRPGDAEHVFNEAATWIEEHQAQHPNERFFTYIQTIDPHVPYDPPESFLQLYDDQPYDGQVHPRSTADLLEGAKANPPRITFSRRDVQHLTALHDGEISYHDQQLGHFVERMKALGVWDNTLFVVTADHGEEFHDHGSYGHGHSIFDELLHVPLVFRLPNTVPARTRVPQTVSSVDIAPTVLGLLGVAPMAAEGRNLTGFMLGAPPAGPAVAFSAWLDDRRVITTGNWKFLIRGNLTASMFHLASDPGEHEQLPVTANPVAARYCRILLGQFLGSRNLGRWLEANPPPGIHLDGQTTEIDQTLGDQLRAIGYAH